MLIYHYNLYFVMVFDVKWMHFEVEEKRILFKFKFFILDGFNQVFSIDHLRCFNPQELQLILCGNQWPSWTLEDLLAYIEPVHGFTRDKFV